MLSPGCRDVPVAASTPATFNACCLISDQTTSSNNVPEDTNLVLAVEASKNYLVRVRATIGKDSGTAGFKFAFTGPTGATIDGLMTTSGNALTNVVTSRYSVIGVVNGTSHIMNVTGQIEFWARLAVGSTAGDLTFQICNGGATTVRRIFAGSAMEALEITGATMDVLASNAVTTSTGPVATDLVLAVAANKKYLIRFDGGIQNSAGGAGIGVDGPAGATIAGWRPVATTGATRIVKEITTLGVITTGTDGGSTTSLFQLWAYVTTGGTAGDLTILFGSTTGGSTTTIFAGATFWLVELEDTV